MMLPTGLHRVYNRRMSISELGGRYYYYYTPT